jgi:hypothetical protein
MKKLLLPFALASTLAGFDATALDLTPRYVNTEIDGYANRQLYIMDESRKIGLGTDRETTVAAESGALVFRFTKLSDASFRIATSPLTPADLLDDPATLERYRASAVGLAPAGATEVKVLEEQANPLPINQWQSHRFLVSYQVGASVTKLGVTFLNTGPSTQLLLVTRSPSRIFDDASSRSFHIIRSWHEIQPGDIAKAAN